MQITLPKQDTEIGRTDIQTTTNSLIVLGANGSGKTRLGSYIENYSEYKTKTHRISAHKSLSFPEFADFKPLDLAELHFKVGYGDTGRLDINQTVGNLEYFKKAYKYSQNINSGMVNDFQSLVDYLFSIEIDVSVKFRQESRVTLAQPPKTKLDRLKEIWEFLLPFKELVIEGQTIKIQVKGNDDKYSSQEMSDGERVIFYLIGQCLCVPHTSYIVVDEPELHIHKSLQNKLWKLLEQEREDCNFIYLTHDIDFAVNHDCEVIWMKSYDGMKWDWELLADLADIPKELIYEIVGSRQPILFTEGTKGSFDYQLFTLLFPDYLIKPLGSCTQVIQTVKSIKNISQLNGLDIYGIIDRDRRTDHEVQVLENDKIFTLKVAEIENMFLIPEVLEKIRENLGAPQTLEQIKNKIFLRLENELNTQIMERVRLETAFLLQTTDLKQAKNLDDLSNILNQIKNLNIKDQYQSIQQEFNQIIEQKDYLKLLEFYNRKSLLETVGKELGIQKDVYIRQVLNLLRDESVRQIYLTTYIPNLGN
ncbi:hypothetical protein A7P53_01520 [Acinetobacter defluvii]|uniref:DUF4435 domain-containing protein n=1 Tax=Acinetobacter defluvii TaxID=1871111 RepID=UPI00149025DE|nr:DUF4435 domain-containing protein [Acinetobacter defluvii]NNP74044.1 hypothetical protein [Acinetobacter defluvii]